MSMTPLPTPPSRQDPVNFSSRADLFMAALANFVAEANALATDVSNNQTTAATAASTASTKAAEAAAARDIVMAAVNYKGAWSSLSGALNIPASVLYNGAIWMLTQNIANVAANTPGIAGCWLNVTPASGLGTAAYQDSSAFQAAFGALAGLVKANGSGGVSAASAADILALIGANAVQRATTADTASEATAAHYIYDNAVDAASKIANRIITWAKMAAMTSGKLIGRSSAGGGDPEEISIGTGLSLSNGTLSCTVTAPVTSVGGYAGAVTQAQVAAAAIAGGAAPASGASYAPLTAFVSATPSNFYSIGGGLLQAKSIVFTRANGTTFTADIIIPDPNAVPS